MKKFLKEYLPYVIILILVILTRTFFVTPVKVNGSSMDDTLSDGYIMILNKISDINRNDIVVIDKSVAGSNLIKRIIALPGETIYCENGVIYINDKKYDDIYAFGPTSDFDKVELAKDEYFVLGDNRLVSEDSRYFGPIKEKTIEGKTNIVLYPFNKIGKVD